MRIARVQRLAWGCNRRLAAWLRGVARSHASIVRSPAPNRLPVSLLVSLPVSLPVSLLVSLLASLPVLGGLVLRCEWTLPECRLNAA